MNSKYTSRVLVIGFVFLALSSCAKQPLTSALFKQSGRAHIYLPTQKEERAGILAERVDYQTKVDTIRKTQEVKASQAKDDKDMMSRTLDAFTVVADRPKIKISTIRNGRINLSFLVQVPKAFMDERYQVVLRPKLLNGDKVVDMPPLVLQGGKFKAKQDAEYARFGDFEKGIIDSTKYDSVYFDKKRHDAFTTKLQQAYLQSYERDYNLQLRYERWKQIMEQRHIDYKARIIGNYDSNMASKSLDMLRKAYDLDLYGEDSASLRRRFDSIYTEERRAKAIARKARELKLGEIPRAYHHLYVNNLTLDSLRNKSLTEQDSLSVAKHTYKHKAIARNEAKRSNKDTFKRHIISLQRVENPHRVDSILPGKDYAYLYSEDIPVTEDLQRRLRVTVETRVTALDRSTWWQSSRDTLSYIVSGINDMVDVGQIERLTGEQREEYQQGLNRLAVRDYRGALEVFNRYPDYNAAVCLIALGYNPQAEKFLEYLKPANGKVDYLKAIVQLRLGNTLVAKDLLLSAARKDPQMGFRSENDPEFAKLYTEQPELLKQVLSISGGDDAPEDI